MRYYYCLVDQEEGMQACGLESKEASYHLEPQPANRSIRMSNMGLRTGYACYFHVTTGRAWTEASRVTIYPSEIENVVVHMANGTSRLDAETEYRDVAVAEAYPFAPNQDIYLVVYPYGSSDNSFEFSFSITGDISVTTGLLDYLEDNDEVYLYAGAGAGGLALLVCVACLARYFARRQTLRANKNVLAERAEKEKEEAELGLRLKEIAGAQPDDHSRFDALADGAPASDRGGRVGGGKPQDSGDETGLVDLFYPSPIMKPAGLGKGVRWN